jgi:PAS domain-containing protein
MLGVLTWMDLAIVGLSSLLAFLTYGVFNQLSSETSAGAPPPEILPAPVVPAMPRSASISFSFDAQGTYLHATAEGDKMLRDLNLEAPDWTEFRTAFGNRFPGLPGGVVITDRPRFTTLLPVSIADATQLGLEQHDCGVTIHLTQRRDAETQSTAQVHDVFSNLSNIEILRAASESAPFPIWHSLKDGKIGWSNSAYRTLDAQIIRSATTAGSPLFVLPEKSSNTGEPTRMSLKDKELNRTYWFDVTSMPCDEGTLNYAVDVHAVVNAESAQRNFVQTLAKTFAHLSTGLAIFDRSRQLVLFNPALIDLTGLQADFLSARPNLFSFFDQLRNIHIMPEPKNYATWRDRIADVVTAASDGSFSEVWHLPSGLTYRVAGRPHPDGAIAFLIEDISAEISLTRQFRGEMEVTHSAMDALDVRIAVFSPQGKLVHHNDAMREFLGEVSLEDGLSIQDTTRLWQNMCQPSPIWGDIRDFIEGCSERETWTSKVIGRNGQHMDVQVAPLVSGASMIALRVSDEKQVKARKKRSSTKAA